MYPQKMPCTPKIQPLGVHVPSNKFVSGHAEVLARVLTQNGRLKNKDAIFVCLNFYVMVRCKKALSERQLQGMPQSTARRFFETYRCIGKRCKVFRSAPLMQRTPVDSKTSVNGLNYIMFIRFHKISFFERYL